MTIDKLQSLYDAVYEYTDQLNDEALNILDAVAEEHGADDIMMKFLTDGVVTHEEAVLLAEVFKMAADECEAEAEDF
jgi:hypothetical protein